MLNDAGLQKEMGSGYDIVLANIVADVIIALAPAVRPLLREGTGSGSSKRVRYIHAVRAPARPKPKAPFLHFFRASIW